LLKELTPACVLVNKGGDILYVHGRTGKYLEQAPGKPNLRILDMAREGLRYPLSSALRRAGETGKEIRETGIRVKTNGDYTDIDLAVKLMTEKSLPDCFMIIFSEAAQPVGERAGERQNGESGAESGNRVIALEQELETLRTNYQNVVEELESSNEELKSSNEEMYSSNEELQSTNEELESSREELESLNEELSTVNSELHNKIEEVQEAYNRITSVLNSTRVAIVFLGNDLRVRRFTREATRLTNLIDKDVGRPFDHISHNLEYENLSEIVRRVLDALTPFEDDVRTHDGHWYRMRVMVHRTEGNVIEGAVLTFINIDAQKQAQEELEKQRDSALSAAKRFTESIVDTVRESLVVLDEKLRVLMANRRFHETFRIPEAEIQGRSFFELGNGIWNIPDLRVRLTVLATSGQSFEDYRVEHRFEDIGFRQLLLNARLLREQGKEEGRILLAMEDLTGEKR